MHTHALQPWQHDHVFLGQTHRRNERRTLAVMALTGTMMVAEIAAGSYFGSMALLADGWHMGTHLGALGIAAFAYAWARRQARRPGYTFGTGKFGDLAGFASALVLALISGWIGYESVLRLVHPVAIGFNAAIGVAVIGLVVNLVSAWLLRESPHGHHGEHDHAHADHGEHPHPHGAEAHEGRRAHHDLNLRSAYLHVMADALTSVFAILALSGGKWLGWTWLDPVFGVVGAAVIAVWAWGLIRDSSRVLLDAEGDPEIARHIRQDIEAGGSDRLADLHLWRVGPGHFAAILSVVTHGNLAPADYKARIGHHPELSHVTVEVQRCG